MKITIYLAMSVNGLISNKRGVPDWLSQEYEKGFMLLTQQKKAVIMGKTTYNILAPDYLPLKDEGTMVVLTHTKSKPEQSNVVFTDESPNAIVSLLENKGHEEAVIIGGTETVSAFLKAGLVNELIFVVEPKIFGSGGLTLFREVDQDYYDLVLSDVEKVNNSVRVRYTVQGT